MSLSCVQVERERSAMILGALKQLNTQYHRRTNTSGPPLCVHRCKVTFKDEPGEGSGVARSFYTAFSQVRHLNPFTVPSVGLPLY